MEVDERKKKELCTVPARYTTATSTEELLTFASTEVQTTPYSEIPESESESNDEPIENLSVSFKVINIVYYCCCLLHIYKVYIVKCPLIYISRY